MSQSSLNPDHSKSDAKADRDSIRDFVLHLIQDDLDKPLNAVDVLAARPELREFPSCVIDLAYEDYCRKRELGQEIPASEFVQQFQGVEQSLYRVIEFDQVLQEHPSLVESVPEERWPNEGDTFCDFELLELLGRGALSRVFVARQTDLGMRHVVVKVCVRGEREADFLGLLEHSGITQVHSIHTDTDTGLAAICMPYVTRATMHHIAEWQTQNADLQTGEQVCREVRNQNEDVAVPVNFDSVAELPNGFDRKAVTSQDKYGELVIKWGVQLANALHFAHQKDVLHCDVKPGNVLILNDLSASLLDFNLAASTTDALRLAGGTLPYMATEQLQHMLPPDDSSVERPAVSAATDVFGLAATIWHVATGEPPFGVAADAPTRADAAEEFLARQKVGVKQECIDSASEVLPQTAIQVLLKALSYETSDRYPDAECFANALQELLPKRRHNWLRICLAVFAFILLAVGSAFLATYQSPAEVAAINAEQLIQHHEFAASREVLAEFAMVDSRCRFLDLYCETCQLETLVYRRNGDQRPKSALEPAWFELQEKWRAMTQNEEFRGAAYSNLAFVRLEFGAADDVKDAEDHFRKAAEFGHNSKANDRIQNLLRLDDDPPNAETSAILHRLGTEIVKHGSRGEFLAFVRMIEHFRRNAPEVDTTEALKLACADLETGANARAETAAISIIRIPLLKDRALVDRAVKLWRAPDNFGPYNRLSEVLALPSETVTPPAVE